MRRRIPPWAAVLVLLAVIGVPLAVGWRRAERSRLAAEAESFAVLAAAQTPGELQEAVGPLGVMLEVRGGGWVAIRYRDSHAAPGWSSAVARDSGGGWFVSAAHFCGRFKGHRLRQAQGESGDPEVTAVEQAGSLEAARAALVRMGFQPVSPPGG